MRKETVNTDMNLNRMRFTPKLEIGRIQHFKSESQNFKMDGSNFRFRISDLKCRIRPISNFPHIPNATSALSAPVPVATTTNCLPERVRYVIGIDVLSYGIFPRQISRPVFLSNA